MDKGSQTELTIQRMPDGGFLITRRGYSGEITSTLFAATSIKEATQYIEDMISPVVPEKQYCPPNLASEIAARTVSVTTEDGGEWQDFGKCRFRKIHAIKFADGRIWDAVNGWRS